MRKFAASLFVLALTIHPALAFNSPGIFSLGDFTISSAGQQITPSNLQQGSTNGMANMPGITALSCQIRFNYGAGGTKTNVYLQTSLDQGSTFFDIANIAFTTSSGVETINLSGLNSLTTPTAPSYLSLADNTAFNGPLGDRFQAVVVSTGTYSGSTLASVRCNPR